MLFWWNANNRGSVKYIFSLVIIDLKKAKQPTENNNDSSNNDQNLKQSFLTCHFADSYTWVSNVKI